MVLSAIERATRLFEVTAALSRALEPEHVADVALRAGLDAVGARGGAIACVDDEARDFVLYEREAGGPRRVARLPLGSGAPIAVCARTGADADAGERGPCLALRVRGHAIGALAVDFGGPPGDGARELLDRIAEQLAQALERTRLYAIERIRREELERSNRMKDDFFGIVSHELRAPLSAILGWSRMLRLGTLDAPYARERALEAIERNAALQAKLVDDLLDVSRIVTGKLALETSAVDLASVVDAAVDSVRPSILGKGVEIRTALAQGALVRGDFRRLQQVLWNLLTNAIKFTPRGGRIDVSIERRGACASIAVKDTGAGIAPDLLPHVFERFTQADAATTRRHGGLGLGLSIVRHVVEAHGGEVRARSEGEGRGCEIEVDLPLCETDGEADGAGDDGPLESAAGRARLEGARVLLVDDDADAREILDAALASAGARVRAASTAREAIEAMDDFRPHVIVADLAMPGEDGYAFIRAVRARAAEEGGLTPALALSGLAQPADRARAVAEGFHAHVAKPVDPFALAAAVAALLAERRPSSTATA